MALLNYNRAYILGVALCTLTSFAFSTHNDYERIYIVESSALALSIFFPMLYLCFCVDVYLTKIDVVLFLQFTYISIISGFILWVNSYIYGILLVKGFFLGLAVTALMLSLLYFDKKTDEYFDSEVVAEETTLPPPHPQCPLRKLGCTNVRRVMMGPNKIACTGTINTNNIEIEEILEGSTSLVLPKHHYI